MSNTRTDPFRAPVKSWAYKAASGLGGCDRQMGKATERTPCLCTAKTSDLVTNILIPRRDSREGMWTACCFIPRYGVIITP